MQAHDSVGPPYFLVSPVCPGGGLSRATSEFPLIFPNGNPISLAPRRCHHFRSEISVDRSDLAAIASDFIRFKGNPIFLQPRRCSPSISEIAVNQCVLALNFAAIVSITLDGNDDERETIRIVDLS